MKKCNTCKQYQDLSQFGKDRSRKDGLCVRCRSCRQIERFVFKERISKSIKNCYQKNRQQRIDYAKNYAAAHREKTAENHRNWRQRKTKQDIQFKLKESLRRRFWAAVSGEFKNGSAIRDLGCSISHLKKYLESLFKEGMTWENWGLGKNCWHIDHIMPLSKFNLTDRQHVVLASHYLNLRPLWSSENLSKGSKCDFAFL